LDRALLAALPERGERQDSSPTTTSEGKMPEQFGGAVLTIECPGCGNRMKETLSRLGSSPQLQCGACQSLLRVDGEQVRIALAALEAAAQAMLDGGVKKIG
jgi:hypothetical protein